MSQLHETKAAVEGWGMSIWELEILGRRSSVVFGEKTV